VLFSRRSSSRGALILYTLGMSGNQDRAERAQAFVGRTYDVAEAIVDRQMTALNAVETKPGDLLASQRMLRAVDLGVRAAKATAALVTPPTSPDRGQTTEDEMIDRDDSPENLERLRTELESRLSELDAALEAKGLSVEPGRWPTARAGREPLQPS
jgi:hypothetical protein